mgnify:CR=1 FL=1
MGIGGFWNFLRSQAAGCFTYDDEEALCLEGLRLCIDGTMLLTTALKSTVTLDEDAWVPAFIGNVLKRVETVVRLTG